MGRKRRKKLISRVEITGIAEKGKSVGRDAEGQVIFVEDAVPGDVVDVLVFQKKKGYMIGRPQAFHHLSEARVSPFCRHFETCGGCRWQHLDYPVQTLHKQIAVENALRRIGKVEIGDFRPILSAGQTVYYRNKLEFSFSSKRWLSREEIRSGVPNDEPVLGFHPPGAFDKVINIEHCWLQADPSNDLRNGIRELALARRFPFFDIKANKGFLRTLMIRTTSLGEVLVLLSFFRNEKDKIASFLDEILERFPRITTLCYCINPKLNDSVADLEMTTHYGKGYVEEKLKHLRFRIGPKSFFQTNTRQAEVLYDAVAELAALKGDEKVYDLYTGIGSIALYLAGKCQRVVGMEEIEAAVVDARENAARNGISNAVFYAGDVKDLLTDDFALQHGKPDLLITDPPRAGMHKMVVERLLRLAVPRIIYISCNPATQARDLQMLGQQYEVLIAQPVDLFPHTDHTENLALLRLKTRNAQRNEI